MEKDGTMKYNNKLELIDAIKSNNKVSFCVIERDDVVKEKLTTSKNIISISTAACLNFSQGHCSYFRPFHSGIYRVRSGIDSAISAHYNENRIKEVLYYEYYYENK